MYYPVFLDLRGRRALVVGAGKVALRKTRALIEAGAEVTVVSPQADPEFASLKVIWKKRRFRRADVGGCALVFAATDDRRVNRAAGLAAAAAGVWANIADSPAECTFLVPSRIRKGNLQVAVSTSGRSPKLAVALRKQIEAILSA